MDFWNHPDGNINHHLESRRIDSLQEMNHRLQMHSSLVRRLALDKVMEGHHGCVNAISWNSSGSLLISGSDDTRVNIWSYSTGGLIHSIDTGHSANIFCTKFVPETCDELLVSGAGDAEVRLFNVSHAKWKSGDVSTLEPSAFFQCHSRRVKKLAVEVGNPHILWSASEDGTLRQHDLRECSTCPPAGSSSQECRNVLLDLRCGAKKSLADPPKLCLLLKSCDISTTRPHQILVGGSDAFARLYDRRMLPPLTTCQTKAKPPPCISYFCPMHLSEHRRSSLHLTHVAFSPNGDEVLLSYSGEHAYLMDVNLGDQDTMRYFVNDVSKLLSINSCRETGLLPLKTSSSQFTGSKRHLGRLEMCKMLVQEAAKTLEEGSNVFHGIEMCNEVLHGKGPDVGPAMRHECLCIRAALLLKRKWKNDVHMAIRDCNNARSINPTSFRAYYYMSKALMQLRKHKEALDYALAARELDPTNSEAAEKVVNIMDHIAAAEEKRNREDCEDSTRGKVCRGRLRSLSDVLLRTGFNSEDSLDGHELERVDSDYEDEMEVDFETSISGDEGSDNEPNFFRGSLNLRFHKRDYLKRDNTVANGSLGLSAQHEASYEPEAAIDMKQRYVGHCNVGTDIKQASFLGQQGEFVASGSDDGRLFIWEKRTGRLVKVLLGDDAVVNCVQCHPFHCTIATSGIDNTIKMWSPHAQVPSIVAGGVAGPDSADVLSIMESNQHKLLNNRLSSSWRDLGCTSLLKELYVLSNVLRADFCVQSSSNFPFFYKVEDKKIEKLG
ncbi:WD repeat protein iqw1 isoform X2 [Dendrobium catenatum]|uniref:WD repeat protein iqw1 isoform X2 n=1 Tax=Dendrobium catenatum TaxID=906689 RepID=UPI0009F3BF2B|nr:WD repeat protein iqw1 isoform X2 [Dendrobium catenatum]